MIEIRMLCIFGNLSEQIIIVKNSVIRTFSHCRSYVNDMQSLIILEIKKYIYIFFVAIDLKLWFGKEMNKDFYEDVLEDCALNQDIKIQLGRDLSVVREGAQNKGILFIAMLAISMRYQPRTNLYIYMLFNCFCMIIPIYLASHYTQRIKFYMYYLTIMIIHKHLCFMHHFLLYVVGAYFNFSAGLLHYCCQRTSSNGWSS